MFSLINSLPLWALISVLIICEVGIVFLLIKKRDDYDKSFKSLIWLLAFILPAFVIAKIIQINMITVSEKNISDIFLIIISTVFALGLIILAIKKLKSGKLTNEQRSLLLFGLILVSFGAVAFICITIYEQLT